MTPTERTVRLIFHIVILLLILMGILLIVLWPFHVLIGFLALGLAIFTILVLLTLLVVKVITDITVKLHEQKLRQERLRPNDYGYYEIPLDGTKVPILPVRDPRYEEVQEDYSRGYTPTRSKNRPWD